MKLRLISNRKAMTLSMLKKAVLTAFFLFFGSQVWAAHEKLLMKRLWPYEAYIQQASSVYGVRVEFIKAIILTESAGKANAVSRKGAIGLMQIHPAHATVLKFPEKYLHNPKINIFVGTWYLRKMLNRYNGDAVLALAAYNAGPGNVDKYKGIPPFKETQKYVRKVLEYYAKLVLPKQKKAAIGSLKGY